VSRPIIASQVGLAQYGLNLCKDGSGGSHWSGNMMVHWAVEALSVARDDNDFVGQVSIP